MHFRLRLSHNLFLSGFLRNSFASDIDPNGNYDTALSWCLEGDDQSVVRLICDTTTILQVAELDHIYTRDTF